MDTPFTVYFEWIDFLCNMKKKMINSIVFCVTIFIRPTLNTYAADHAKTSFG